MKRYWKSVTLLVLTLIIFGIYYAYIHLTPKQFPTFTLQTIEGPKEALEHLSIQGGYSDGGWYANFIMDDQKMKYRSDLSYLSVFFNDSDPKYISDLQKKYRNFMRDKQKKIAGFGENEKYLAYADIHWNYQETGYDLELYIDVLTKETKKSQHFNLPIPKQEDYHYIYVNKVIFQDPSTLKVVTINSSIERYEDEDDFFFEQYISEQHVYTIDIEKQALIDEEIIRMKQADDDEAVVQVNWIYDRYSQMNDYLIFYQQESLDPMVEENAYDEYGSPQTMEERMKYFIAYHIESGEQKVIDLPKEIPSDAEALLYEEPLLYLERYTPNEYQVIVYHLLEEEMVKELRIPTTSMDKQPVTLIQNQKLYFLDAWSPEQEGAPLAIWDLLKGEKIYEGIIQSEDQKVNEDKVDFYFLDVQ